MKTPCYQCTRRKVGCHEHCDDYGTWQRNRNAARDKKRQEQDADAVLIENSIKIRDKMLERKKKGGL